MKSKTSHGAIGSIADILLVLANFLFGFLVIYFLIIASAPLFGGISLPLISYIPFVYWAGFYFVTKYFLKSIRDQRVLKDYQYWLICLYLSVYVLNYPIPFNLIAFVLLFVSLLKIVKKEIYSWEMTTNHWPYTSN